MHPNVKTTAGLSIFSEPVVAMDEMAPGLAEELLAILSATRSTVPHPRSWNGLVAPLLQAANVRSYKAFAESTKCVGVDLEKQVVSFLPTRNGGRQQGFFHLNNKVVRCRAGPTEVDQALRAAFNACE
jgi:hypothetical protein